MPFLLSFSRCANSGVPDSLKSPACSCANEIFVIADVQLPVDEDHGVDVGVGLGSVGAGATEGVGPVKAVASFVLASPSNFFSSA